MLFYLKILDSKYSAHIHNFPSVVKFQLLFPRIENIVPGNTSLLNPVVLFQNRPAGLSVHHIP